MNLEFIKPQDLGSFLMKSSQSNFNLRLPCSYLVRSYLITTVTHDRTLDYTVNDSITTNHFSIVWIKNQLKSSPTAPQLFQQYEKNSKKHFSVPKCKILQPNFQQYYLSIVFSDTVVETTHNISEKNTCPKRLIISKPR